MLVDAHAEGVRREDKLLRAFNALHVPGPIVVSKADNAES